MEYKDLSSKCLERVSCLVGLYLTSEKFFLLSKICLRFVLDKSSIL